MKSDRLISWFSLGFTLVALSLFTSMTHADSPPITVFPSTGQYHARLLKDKHDVAVIELAGNYGKNTAEGKANVEPRTVIAKEFYRTHPDHYDFIVVFSNFEFETPGATAFHWGVQNKVKGLGLPEFDNTSQFSSNGKLLGYIDMAALTRYATNPFDAKFDTVLQVFSHEFLHQWGAHTRFRAADGSISSALLGKDNAHWSFLLNSGASVEYGNQWRDNRDGTFTSVAGSQFFSPLDLYLMGMYRKEEVPPFFLIENPDVDKTRTPLNNVTISGVRKDLTVDDIIAAEGSRIPDANHAQKEFRLGFVLLSRSGAEATDEQIAAVNTIRQAINTRVAVLTGGRALAHSYSETASIPVVVSGDPSGGQVRPSGANLQEGLTWLRGKQSADGSWKDHTFTTVRDTVVALDTMANLDGQAFVGKQKALTWLTAQGASNTDYLARTLRALSSASADSLDDAPRLLAIQNTDGGWGVASGYQSNPLDTALVMLALRPFESTIARGRLDSATAFLTAQQNADGGWGNLIGGVSRTSVSTTVLQALNGRVGDAGLLPKAVTFLASRQNADGGFGDSPSTVHDTANVVLALLAQNSLASIRAADATSYVASTQHIDGSWDGSVYSTALALRLLKSSGLFNWVLTDFKASPESPLDGQQTILSFKVANNGTDPAPAGIVRIYDGDPATAGRQIGQDINVPALLVGDKVELKLLWNTLDRVGAHDLYAVVDPGNLIPESSKSDNHQNIKVVVRGASLPIELIVNGSDVTVNPARPSKLFSAFGVSALVSNIGMSDAIGVRVVLRVGDGASARIVDQQIVNLLGRTQQVVNFSATLERAGATKYSIVIDPDALINEPDRSNNIASITVESSTTLDIEARQSDLTVVRTPVYIGSDAEFKTKIRNVSTQDSPPFKVRYSVTNGIQTSEVTTRTLQLAAGAVSDQDVFWRTEFAGDLTFKVEIDPDAILSESDRTNNTATVPFKVIAAVGANLALSFKDLVVLPTPALESKDVSLSQIVRNIGNVAASDIEVAFYDGDPASSRLIGTVQKIPSLAPGQSATVSVTWVRFPDAQNHVIFVVVDPASKQTEISRDDNIAFVDVSAMSMVDLAISSGDLITSPQSPKSEDEISIVAKVTNLGQQAASNVIVRALDGAGVQIGSDQTVVSFAGLSSQTFHFVLPAAQSNGARSIVIVVDPDNTIEEKSKSNNTVRRDLVVQDGDLFVTNRFFSPNGDGVKDDTTLGFRLQSVSDVTVNVVNKRGQIIRSFSGDTLKNIQSGSVTWDGLNQRGSVVQDGDYRLRVLSLSGTLIGEVIVTLDTDRSSIINAIDTPYERFTNLSCELNGPLWPDSLKVTADEERMYLLNGLSYNSQQKFPSTHFRESANGTDLTALLSPSLQQLGGWGGFYISLNGEKIGLTRNGRNNSTGNNYNQLWAIDGDGRNAKLVRDFPNGTPNFNVNEHNLNSDGTAYITQIGNTVQSIPTDGVSAETILVSEADLAGGSIEKILFSPDRHLALVQVHSYPNGAHYILVDVQTGRRKTIPAELPQTGYRVPSWAPNSKLFVMGGMLRSLGVEGASVNDARFYVFDEDFKVVNTFETHVGGEGSFGYEGEIGDVTWASSSSEFAFGHSFCLVNCPQPSLAVASNGLVSEISVTPSGQGGQHNLMRADLTDGNLEIISTSNTPSDFSYFTYLWAPNERTILRLCLSGNCRNTINAIDLDDSNKIRPLFQNWQQAPDVIQTQSQMTVQGFLPSGRKLMFSSYRAARNVTSSCYQSGPDQYSFETLLNMTADLRPLRSPAVGGLVLRGTAADQNFSRYVIEYALVSAPNDWKTVAPASDTPVVDAVFTNWVPPAFGNYLLRLTVEDLAGNKRQQIRRISWSDTPSITDLYKDVEFISPNGDTVQDLMNLHYRVLEPVHLEFNVYAKDETKIRSVARDHFSIGQEAYFSWDGRDDYGHTVPDGQYRITVQNYEFFVTVDNKAPEVTLTMDSAYGSVVNPETRSIFVAYKPTLKWKSDDLNYASMLIERGAGAEPTDWQEVQRYPGASKAREWELKPAEFVGKQYRITAIDKAGNRTLVRTPLGDQQVFLLQYTPAGDPSNHVEFLSLDPKDAPQTLGDLRHLARVSPSGMEFGFAETVRKPLSKVILQVRELKPEEGSLPLSSLNAMIWNEKLISGVVAEDYFQLNWDLQGVQVQKDYMVRVKVVDEDGGEFFALFPAVVRLDKSLEIVKIESDEKPQYDYHDLLNIKANVHWDEPISKIDLLIVSTDDPRYLTERVIHTVENPDGDYSHYLGNELLKEWDLRLCSKYSFRLRATTASGVVVYSKFSKDLPPQCLGIDWVVVPETAEACNLVPSSKMKVMLRPYSKDGRKMTQLLFGRVLDDGHEEILNNWNDISAPQYIYLLDNTNVTDGQKNYFVRVINEDGKNASRIIPITVAHKPPVARITSPVAGQKMCGINARSPLNLEKLVKVVPVEASITGDSNISYGLEYGLGATPIEWKLFSPNVPEDLDRIRARGFESEYCDPRSKHYYPDSKLCFDFHPIQWSSYKAPNEQNWPGVAASSGTLGRLGLFEQIDGEISVRLRLYNAAGHQVCTAPVTFEFDNKVQIQASSVDRKIFSATVAEPNNKVVLQLSADEALKVDIQVFHANIDAYQKVTTIGEPIRTVARGETVSIGSISYAWDGRDQSSTVAADGWYVLRITYTDGCGNTLVEERAVELDSTPPQVNIVSPIRDAQIGLIASVIGSVRDSHFSSYSIQFALPANPDAWITLKNSSSQTPAEITEQELVSWNTLGLSGPVTLRIVALDLLGNQTVVALPVQIVARTDLISDLNSVPAIFSPNGDGKRDTTVIRYNLLSPVKATLQILRGSENGPVVRTLLNNASLSSGAANTIWDGRNSNGAIEIDGIYVAKLTVTALDNISVKQEVLTQFALDNTPPKVIITYPSTDFVTPKGNISFSATDLYFESYKAYFTTTPAAGNWQLLAEGVNEQPAGIVTALDRLPDGKYGVKVVAIDKAENATEVIKFFEIDSAPPKVSLVFPLADSFLSGKKGAINIVGTVEEKNLTMYKLRYGQGSVSENFAELATGTTLPVPAVLKAWDITQIADGPYTLWLKATDLAAQSAETQIKVVVDNTSPTAAITNPANGGYVKQAMDITGTALDENFKEYKLEVAAGSKAMASRWSVLSTSATGVSDGLLLKWQALPSDGQQTLKLTVTDKAGNVSETFSEVVVDTIPPVAPINLDGKTENRKDVRLTWTTNGEKDLAGYILFRNGTRINQIPVTENSYLDLSLANGSYVYLVKAVDKAGWESAPSNSVTMSVNLSGPTAQIFTPARGGLVSSLIDIKGSANATDFKEYRLYVGAGAAPAVWQLLRRSPVPTISDILGNWNTLGLAENSVQTLKLEAEDIFGVIATDTATITVDNVPPSPPLMLNAVANIDAVTLTWTASGSPDVAGYLLYRDERIANATGVVVGSLKPYTIVTTNYVDLKVADGKHNYFVQAIDKAENVSDPSNTVQVTLDNHAPHATIIKPIAGSNFDHTTYVLATALDTDIATVQFQFKPFVGGAWANIGPAVVKLPYEINWDPTGLAFGSYLLQAVATDISGNIDPAPTPIQVNYKNLSAPEIVIGLKARVNGGDATLTWNASAAPDLAGYHVDRINADGVVTRLTTTPIIETTLIDMALEDGIYGYRVYAINLSKNLSKPSVDVKATIYTPEIVQPYTPSSAAVFTLHGKGQANAKAILSLRGDVVVQVDPLPDGEFSKADIALDLGDNQYSLKQQDADGNVSKAAAFHVLRALPPSAPAGLRGNANGLNVTLNWTPNNEANLLGYRVLNRGQAGTEPAPAAVASASSVYNNGYSAAMAVDGNPDTRWFPRNDQPAKGQWLELRYQSPLTITGMKLNFGWDYIRDYDIEAWDGQVWVLLASVRANSARIVDTTLSQGYLTDRVRVKVLDATYPSYPFIAEAMVTVMTTQAAVGWTGVLENGMQSFDVYAQNSFGMFSPSSPITIAVGDVVAPEAPVLNRVVTGADVSLTWTAPAASDVASYELFRDGVSIAIIADIQNRTFVDRALPNATYRYTVTATDGFNNVSSRSNEVTAIVNVDAPSGPIGLQIAVPSSGGALSLTWNQPVGGAVPASYRLKRSTIAGGPYELVTEGLIELNYIDQSVNNGVRYFYVVSAVDLIGNNGTQSNEVSGIAADTLAPGAPVFFAPTPSGSSIVTRNPLVDITGYAEPGSSVALLRNQATLDIGTALSASASKSLEFAKRPQQFDLSGDGRRLAVSSDNLSIVDVDTGITKAIPGTSYPSAARWSKDGQSIAFMRYDPNRGKSEVYVYKDGSDAPTKESTLYIRQNIAAWSADGLTLAVIADDENERSGLWLIDRTTKTNRLLVEGPTFEFSQRISWSPDGRTIAYERRNTVFIVNVASATVTSVDQARGSRFPSWSFDGSRVIYQYTAASGNSQVGEFQLSSGDLRALGSEQTNHGRSLYPQWAAGVAGDYITTNGYQLTQYKHDGSVKAILGENISNNGEPVIVTTSGYLAYRSFIQGSEESAGREVVTRLTPAGLFRFPKVRLNAGDNLFGAQATDAARNQSANADPITVTLNAGSLPDLAAELNDIVVLPSTPLVGEKTRITAVVRNIGNALASNFNVSVKLRDSHGVLISLLDKTVAALGAGESTSFAIDWTAADAGQYSLVLALDASAVVSEASESNNVAVREFTVAASVLPTLTAYTDAATYGANSPVKGSFSVFNGGPQFSGKLVTWIEDQNGFLVAKLAPVVITDLLFGQSVQAPADWNTSNILAGGYRLFGKLFTSNDALVGSAFRNFSIDPDRKVLATVVTDRVQYKAQQSAQLSGTVQLISANSVLQSGTALIQVLNDKNDVIFESSQALGNLSAGASAVVNVTWAIGSSPAGHYRVKITVQSNGNKLAEAETSLEVVVDLLAKLTGSFTMSASSVAAGDRVVIAYALKNAGTLGLTALPITISVIDPDSTKTLAKVLGTVDIAAGASAQGQAAFDVVAWPLKPLQILLTAELDGRSVVLQRATLHVIDRVAPVVTFVSPTQNGFFNSNERGPLVRATDTQSSVASVEYSLNELNWNPLAAQMLTPELYSAKLIGLADGPITIFARATDQFSNVSSPVRLDAIVDNTAPLIVVAGLVDGGRYVGAVTPLITIIELNLATTVITLDGQAFVSGTVVGATGPHTLQIAAEDKAGNKSLRVVQFQIGNPPSVIVTAPANASVVRTPFTLTGIATSDNVAIAKLEYQIDGGLWADMQVIAGNAGQYQTSIIALSDGSHTAALRATDVGGQMSGLASIIFMVDNTAPIIVVSGVTDGQKYSSTVTPVIAITDNNLVSSTSLLDGATYLSGTAVSSVGSHTLQIDALDKAGNRSSKTILFQIVHALPTVSITAPSNGAIVRTPLTLTGTAASAGSTISKVEYQIDGGAWTLMSLVSGQYQATIASLPDGAHRATLRATDAEAQQSALVSVDVITDNTAPIIVVSGVADGQQYSSTVTPVIAITDNNLASSTSLLDGVAYVSGTAVSAVGSHTLQIDALDKAGNRSSKTVLFQIVHALPTVAIIAPSNGAIVRTPLTLTGTAASVGGMINKVEYQIDGGAWALMSLVSGQYQATIVSLPDGAHRATLRATDAESQQSALVSVDVVVKNVEPGAGLVGTVSLSTKEIPIGDALIVSFTATNNGDAVLSDLPLKVSIIDSLSQTVVAEYPYVHTLAVGGNYGASTNWTATGTAGAKLLVRLTATVAGKTLKLAEDSFVLAAPQIKVSVSQAENPWQNVLVYSACKRAADDLVGRCGATPIPIEGALTACDTSRTTALNSYLNGLALPHKVTSSETEFLHDLRSGLYNTLWMNSGATAIRELGGSEVRAAILRGNGLLIDGMSESRSPQLTQCAGVNYNGIYTTAEQVITMTGPLYIKDSFRISAAQVKLAGISGSVAQAKMGGATPTDGIVSNLFGTGKALAFGFDLADTLRVQTNESRWLDVTQRSFNYLKSDIGNSQEYSAGQVFTLATNIHNDGQAVNVRVVQTLPAGAEIISTDPVAAIATPLNGATATWSASLAAGEDRILKLRVRVPSTAGTFSINTVTNQVNGNVITPIKNQSYDMSVKSSTQLLVQLISNVAALNLATEEQIAVRSASIDELHRAQLALMANSNDEVLRRLLSVQGRLSRIDASGAQVSLLVKLIAAVEWQIVK